MKNAGTQTVRTASSTVEAMQKVSGEGEYMAEQEAVVADKKMRQKYEVKRWHDGVTIEKETLDNFDCDIEAAVYDFLNTAEQGDELNIKRVS